MWELLIWKLKFWIRNSSTDAEALAFGMPYWHHADIPAFCPIGDGLPIGSHRSDCGNWLVPEFLECHHASHPVIILCLLKSLCQWTAGGLVFEISGKFRYDAEAAQDPVTRPPECHPWIVTRWNVSFSKHRLKKLVGQEDAEARKGLKDRLTSIGRQYFFPRGKCRITVLGRIMTLPKWSFMEWQRTSRVVFFLYFICNFRRFCWKSCNRTWMLT